MYHLHGKFRSTKIKPNRHFILIVIKDLTICKKRSAIGMIDNRFRFVEQVKLSVILRDEVVMLVLSKLSWDSIGFTKTKIVQNVLKGLALGVSCFSIAYLVECVLLYCMNGNVQLSVYTSGFSLNGSLPL